MIDPNKKEFFKESLNNINKINPLQPSFHYKMLNQFKNYHLNAKKNAKFSLITSLEIFSKFCVTDIWLNKVVNEEIEFLKSNQVKNPYH